MLLLDMTKSADLLVICKVVIKHKHCTSTNKIEKIHITANVWRFLNIFVTAYLIHTHPFNSPFSGTNRWAGTRKDFNEARDSEWQWHQLGHMQVCTALKTDNHASTSQAGCPFCRPTNSVKALKAQLLIL